MSRPSHTSPAEAEKNKRLEGDFSNVQRKMQSNTSELNSSVNIGFVSKYELAADALDLAERGRDSLSDKKITDFRIRMTMRERSDIDVWARGQGITASEAMRRIAFATTHGELPSSLIKVEYLPAKTDAEMVSELRQIRMSLGMITKYIIVYGEVPDITVCELRGLIDVLGRSADALIDGHQADKNI